MQKTTFSTTKMRNKKMKPTSAEVNRLTGSGSGSIGSIVNVCYFTILLVDDFTRVGIELDSKSGLSNNTNKGVMNKFNKCGERSIKGDIKW